VFLASWFTFMFWCPRNRVNSICAHFHASSPQFIHHPISPASCVRGPKLPLPTSLLPESRFGRRHRIRTAEAFGLVVVLARITNNMADGARFRREYRSPIGCDDAGSCRLKGARESMASISVSVIGAVARSSCGNHVSVMRLRPWWSQAEKRPRSRRFAPSRAFEMPRTDGHHARSRFTAARRFWAAHRRARDQRRHAVAKPY